MAAKLQLLQIKDLTSLSLELSIFTFGSNLNEYEVLIKKDSKWSKGKREQNRSLTLKAKKDREHPSETMVFHNEDGNPARANVKQALGSYERPHKGVKASANSDVMYFFTSAQDGDPLQDDVRLCLGDDLKKAQDHIRMTKVIKGEFEKLEDLKGKDVLLTCDTSLKSHEVDDDMGYDPSDVAFTKWLGSKIFNYKTIDHYTMKALWIYWIRGDDEAELTDEESSDDEDEVAKDYEWYEALKDSELKEEALRNKAIMEGLIEEDDDDEKEKSYVRFMNFKEDEYNDLIRANKDACRAYQEIFRMMDEGWTVTRAEQKRS
ncbi:hypothetical protein Tco_1006635 [Tanacetum coccineum]|uniref:Uncharacterized protein n=1 Tax=Tanacetum coccineum TaxID=301880 RepID=A0ABQ5FK75_9ASTR